MHVSDAPPPSTTGAATKDEACAAGEEASNGGRRRPGRSFRGALESRRGTAPATDGHDVASAAALAAWFRPESAAAPGGVPASGRAAGVAAAQAVDRILIGAGPDGAQARIRIGAGALAGTELQLSSGAAAHTVEARLLTHAASSRQTLSVVLDEIRSRLRDKGIVLSTAVPAARPRPHPRDAAGLDDPSRELLGDRVGTDR
jgi:hypothetical protein